MKLAIALSFGIRLDEAIVSRTISVIPPDSREDWIIRQARERPAAERAAFLDGACAGDEAFRQRLEARLAAHDQAETLLASQADTARPTIKLDLADAPDEAVGHTMGRFFNNEPVVARPAGTIYWALKQVQRNNVAFAGAAVRRCSRVDLRHRQQAPIDQGY